MAIAQLHDIDVQERMFAMKQSAEGARQCQPELA